MSSADQSPLVVAVVLTWNDTELATRCLESVFASDYPNLQVVLVDNGSVPPVGPTLQAEFPDLTLVQNAENQGFSGGANRGLEKALELGADYVQLIGNDATLAPHAIAALIAECESNTDIGAAGPLLLDAERPDTVQFYRATLDRDQAAHYHEHVGELHAAREWPTVDSEFIPCVALLFRGKALREIGLLDESFGTCWEDYDLCLRLRDAGWRYVTVGASTAVHVGSYTTGRTSPYIVYYTTRNRLICLQRYSRDCHSPKRWWALFRSFTWNMRQYGLLNWRCHFAMLRGFFDYFVRGSQGEALRTESGKVPGVS
ncbi:MAG: glycosyltransferase family 2 protein [Gammaproteobacteria bacterium]|nr:glycosyltransferase family 2 protein [Gammaproteobacteria bacterium]